jgi:hypothetical protein
MILGGIIFNAFLVHFVCLLPELYGWCERMVGNRDMFDAVYDSWRCAFFIIWFLVGTWLI